ncbi:hypothetical protein ACTFIU_008980 [Dictyostelium citrinum]
MKTLKVCVVGEGGIGKTSMLLSYTTNSISNEYQPTVFDNYSTLLMHNKKPYNLSLWDSAGQEEFSKLRRLSYPQTDVFLLCFSVINPSSFSNILDSWVDELNEHCPNTPIVLVGTQMDLKSNSVILDRLCERKQLPISTQQGIELAKKINAFDFVECSALTQRNLHLVFERAIDACEIHQKGQSKEKKKNNKKFKKNCIIM